MKPTHFFCIPLVTTTSQPQLIKNLNVFKTDVANLSFFKIPKTAMRSLNTIHITLGIITLFGNERLSKAVKMLNSIKPLLPKSRPKISLQGLSIFQTTDIRHADIFFAHPTCRNYNFEAFCH